MENIFQSCMKVGHESDFTRILIVEIHVRAFGKTTTIVFQCLIFSLCREVTIIVIAVDELIEVTKIVVFGLI